MTSNMLGHNDSDPHTDPKRACLGIDTEAFFPSTQAQADRAARVCRWCPVLARCAVWALREGFTDGVVASVWMPPANVLPARRIEAYARLERVAAAGRAWPEQSKAVA